MYNHQRCVKSIKRKRTSEKEAPESRKRRKKQSSIKITREFNAKGDFFEVNSVGFLAKNNVMLFKFEKCAHDSGGWVYELTGKLGGFFCVQIRPNWLEFSWKLDRRNSIVIYFDSEENELGIIQEHGPECFSLVNGKLSKPILAQSLEWPAFIKELFVDELKDTQDLIDEACAKEESSIKEELALYDLPASLSKIIIEYSSSVAIRSARFIAQLHQLLLKALSNPGLPCLHSSFSYLEKGIDMFIATPKEKQWTSALMKKIKVLCECLQELSNKMKQIKDSEPIKESEPTKKPETNQHNVPTKTNKSKPKKSKKTKRKKKKLGKLRK